MTTIRVGLEGAKSLTVTIDKPYDDLKPSDVREVIGQDAGVILGWVLVKDMVCPECGAELRPATLGDYCLKCDIPLVDMPTPDDIARAEEELVHAKQTLLSAEGRMDDWNVCAIMVRDLKVVKTSKAIHDLAWGLVQGNASKQDIVGLYEYIDILIAKWKEKVI